MGQKLAFELLQADGSDRYAVRLVDRQQIAALADAEGLAMPMAVDRVVVAYDEGSGELVPVDGFDSKTARGRVEMRILSDVYCEALERITARAKQPEAPARRETFVFQQ